MILKELRIDSWVGDVTNCYIVQDEKSKETMVIDPAGDVDKIVEMLDILNANLKYIYLTHCHGDHIGGVKELKERKGGKILAHRNTAENLLDPNISLTTYIGLEGRSCKDNDFDQSVNIAGGSVGKACSSDRQ